MTEIYIASKTKHASKWRELRKKGYPIISTWIDESETGSEIEDFSDLWIRCIKEASTCNYLIVYREPDETLKGAWCEVGAALAHGIPVFSIGCSEFSVSNHPLIRQYNTFSEALYEISIRSIQPTAINEEIRIRKFFKERAIENILAGEVTIWDKVDNGWQGRKATADDIKDIVKDE